MPTRKRMYPTKRAILRYTCILVISSRQRDLCRESAMIVRMRPTSERKRHT